VKLPPRRAQILCSVSKTGALASSARRNVSDAVNSIVSALAQVRCIAVPRACGALAVRTVPTPCRSGRSSLLRPLLAAEVGCAGAPGQPGHQRIQRADHQPVRCARHPVQQARA